MHPVVSGKAVVTEMCDHRITKTKFKPQNCRSRAVFSRIPTLSRSDKESESSESCGSYTYLELR